MTATVRERTHVSVYSHSKKDYNSIQRTYICMWPSIDVCSVVTTDAPSAPAHTREINAHPAPTSTTFSRRAAMAVEAEEAVEAAEAVEAVEAVEAAEAAAEDPVETAVTAVAEAAEAEEVTSAEAAQAVEEAVEEEEGVGVDLGTVKGVRRGPSSPCVCQESCAIMTEVGC